MIRSTVRLGIRRTLRGRRDCILLPASPGGETACPTAAPIVSLRCHPSSVNGTMFRNTRGLPGLAVAALSLVLAACGGDYSGGYEKVSFREAPSLMLAATPNPPPVIPGFGGAGAAAPVLAPENTPAGVTQEMVENGQQLFGTVCAACHGMGGGGSAAGPQLSDREWLHIAGSFDDIVGIIQTGVATPQVFAAPMPPMGGGSFDADQVRAIAAYVYALSVQDGV